MEVTYDVFATQCAASPSSPSPGDHDLARALVGGEELAAVGLEAAVWPTLTARPAATGLPGRRALEAKMTEADDPQLKQALRGYVAEMLE